ncbi:hypothetical protein MMC25_005434 [Agyrium rufum]|nr:hypothetical protein [Agyrium rufum]
MEHPTHSGYNFTQTIHNDIYPAIDPTKFDLSQAGKIVLIRGSGRDISRSTALRFAESGAASIILCARTACELDEVDQRIHRINSHVEVHKHAMDITDDQTVLTVAKTVAKEEGGLDILVNNAGMTNNWEPITEGDSGMYLKTWNLHVKNTYLMLRAFLPLMVETARTHSVRVDIVNLSTIAAHFVIPGASAYQVSKFALIRLSEIVTAEYGAQGVNCVTLHPGGVATGIYQRIASYGFGW